jgi:hypothetical protein
VQFLASDEHTFMHKFAMEYGPPALEKGAELEIHGHETVWRAADREPFACAEQLAGTQLSAHILLVNVVLFVVVVCVMAVVYLSFTRPLLDELDRQTTECRNLLLCLDDNALADIPGIKALNSELQHG